VLTVFFGRYWAFKNAWSMDNLPGMKRGLEVAKQESVAPIKKMVGPLAPTRYQTGYYGLEHIVLVAVFCLIFGVFAGAYGPDIIRHSSAVLPRDLRTSIKHPLSGP
jgi:hypothetical protein